MNYSISTEIISGYKTGNIVLIPRIDTTSSKDEIPFELKRRQFPLRLGQLISVAGKLLIKLEYTYQIQFLVTVTYM